MHWSDDHDHFREEMVLIGSADRPRHESILIARCPRTWGCFTKCYIPLAPRNVCERSEQQVPWATGAPPTPSSTSTRVRDALAIVPVGLDESKDSDSKDATGAQEHKADGSVSPALCSVDAPGVAAGATCTPTLAATAAGSPTSRNGGGGGIAAATAAVAAAGSSSFRSRFFLRRRIYSPFVLHGSNCRDPIIRAQVLCKPPPRRDSVCLAHP